MTLQDLTHRLTEDVKPALDFLNQVVENNPGRDLSEIEARPDVQEALETVLDWLDEVEDFVRAEFPSPLMDDDTKAVKRTLDKATDDIVEKKVWKDRTTTRRLIIRFDWLIDWLMLPLYLIAILLSPRTEYTRKTWISRLSPTTCSTCRALHGVTIPVQDSFKPFAIRAGWTRFYGSLMSPPMHPRCQCSVLFS